MKVYAEGFVTFFHNGNKWTASIWDAPPDSLGPVYRIRVPVPEDLARPEVGEIVVNEIAEGEGSTV